MAMAQRKKRKRGKADLGRLSVDEFMAGFGTDSEDERSEVKSRVKRKKTKGVSSDAANGSHTHSDSIAKLATTDPDFYQFLQDNDQDLLAFDEGAESEGVESEGVESDMGQPEQRPESVTSRREAVAMDTDNESTGDVPLERELGLSVSEVNQLVKKVKKVGSVKNLKSLTQALHTAVEQTLDTATPDGQMTSASVFNSLVIACLKHVQPYLAGLAGGEKPEKTKGWSKLKRVVKQYLSDLLKLLGNLQDPVMQCAVIRNVKELARYAVGSAGLCRAIEKQLVESWSSGENHVQVMAFLALRELTLSRPAPALTEIIKKLYMAFVRNTKFTSAESLPRIQFMSNCLLELLSVEPGATYQLGFVYIRQLAIHLRAAITSGKKDGQQAVYNWQFVHCLVLWGRVLGHVTIPVLRPLIYPLVQVMLSTLSVQPSPRYYPLRLHITRSLLQLARDTRTYIPITPHLLEVLENYGKSTAKLQTGKPPNLSLLLRATKPHLSSRSYHSAVLNLTFEQLLEFSVSFSHLIGYPELMFPIVTRVRKVSKSTQYSWLRLQLQQLLAKIEEVCRETTKAREELNCSPAHSDQILAWENSKKLEDNPLKRFLTTWTSTHTVTMATRQPVQTGSREKKRIEVDNSENSEVESETQDVSCDLASGSHDLSDGEDLVVDFELTDDSD